VIISFGYSTKILCMLVRFILDLQTHVVLPDQSSSRHYARIYDQFAAFGHEMHIPI